MSLVRWVNSAHQYLRDRPALSIAAGLAIGASFLISVFPSKKNCVLIEDGVKHLLVVTVLGVLSIAFLSRTFSCIGKKKKPLSETRIVNLKRPFPASSDPVVSLILQHVPEQMKRLQIVTNCRTIKEAQVIFLGDCHDDRSGKDLRDSLLEVLSCSGDSVYLEKEKKKKIRLQDIDEITPRQDLVYQGWDLDDINEIFNREIYAVGFPLKTKICIALREKVLPLLERNQFQFSDPNYMEEARRDSSSFLFLRPEESASLEREWSQRIQQATESKNEVIELFWRLCQAHKASQVCATRIHLEFFKKRQQSLVSCLEKLPASPNKQFYIAGTTHLFDEFSPNTFFDVDPVLATGIKQFSIKYIMVRPLVSVEKIAEGNSISIDTDQEAGLEYYPLMGIIFARVTKVRQMVLDNPSLVSFHETFLNFSRDLIQ